MKNLLLIFCLSFILFSCNDLKPKVPQIILSGQIENTEDTIIELFQNNSVIKLKPIKIAKDGSFSDTIYDIIDAYHSIQIGREYTNLYLKDGYDLFIYIDAENFDESIRYKGIGANENNFLAQKVRTSENFNYWAFCKFDEELFTPKLDSLVSFKNALLNEHMELVPEFDKKMIELETINNQYFGAYVKERYVSMHKYYNKLENFEVSENFYDYRKRTPLENNEALKTHFYSNYVEAYIGNKIVETDTSEYAFEAIRTINREIQDNKLKKEFIYQSAKDFMSSVKDIDSYWAIISYMITDKPRFKELKKIYTEKKKIETGNKSPLTSFTDYEDKPLKLEDFKGKYIYIDMWAQWCGPCKREAPFLKEIETKYADKNIHFLKLSLDQDTAAWKNYIIENKATDNSFIIANAFDSEFAKSYMINSIPRFILLDKELNIIDANAPRPSDEKLKEVLDKLL